MSQIQPHRRRRRVRIDDILLGVMVGALAAFAIILVIEAVRGTT